eukprot:m.64217 g.64217  ORF g.64217 m.64217 type:complete len:91 (-) comp11631_c0_seq1:25-297(-)
MALNGARVLIKKAYKKNEKKNGLKSFLKEKKKEVARNVFEADNVSIAFSPSYRPLRYFLPFVSVRYVFQKTSKMTRAKKRLRKLNEDLTK